MERRINLHLKEGTYQIVCTGCGFVNHGPQEGSETDAARKAMEIENTQKKCANGCDNELTFEIHTKVHANKYNENKKYTIKTKTSKR